MTTEIFGTVVIGFGVHTNICSLLLVIPQGNKSVDIFPDHVKLEVHPGTWRQLVDIGMFIGVGDDGYRETISSDIK